MTKFVVLLHTGMNQATIALEGYEPTDGSVEVGSFEMDVNPLNNQTTRTEMGNSNSEHAFITNAKRVIADSGEFTGNVDRLTFLDKASNAPVHEEVTLSTNDTDAMNVNEERSDAGSVPAGGEGAQNDGTNGAEGEETKKETVEQLKERIAGISDKDELEREFKAEQEGQNRATALAAFEARAKELTPPEATENGDQTGTETTDTKTEETAQETAQA